MTFTKTDFILTLSFLTAVILLSFIAPAVGMTGDSVNSTDIPEFNVTGERFNWVEDLPEYPSEPSSGVLNHSSTKFDNYRGNIQTELGTGDNGNRIFIVAINNDTVHLTDVEDSTINASVTFSANDQTKNLKAYGYDIDVHSVNITHGKYEWIAAERPDDSSLPLIGGALNVADSIAAGVIWIGSTIVVGVILIVELFVNGFGVLFDVLVFVLAVLNFIFSNYLAIIAGAPSGFAAALVSIPGVGISVQFARVGLIIISQIPFFGSG